MNLDFTVQRVLAVGHKAQSQPEMESLKGDMPSCDSIKLCCHCTRHKFAAVYTQTHIGKHTQTYTHTTHYTQLAITKNKTKQSVSKLGTSEGEQKISAEDS